MEYKKSPLKAIRAKCLECSNYQHKEVTLCPVTDCDLFPYRFGKNPYLKKRVLSEEQKQVLVDRLKHARESKKR